VDYNTWYFLAALFAYEAFDVAFGAGINSNVCHFSGLTIGSLLGLGLRRQIVPKDGEDASKGVQEDEK
jgi:membrane associated rhomboid family serine protease